MSYVVVVLRVLVAVTFAVAALSKSRSRRSFLEFRDGLGLLVPAVASRATLLAAGTLTAEWSVVITLAVPATVTFGFVLAACALVAFTAAVTAAIRRGVDVQCRCFGAGHRPVGPPQVVRNVVLFGAAVAGVIVGSGHHPAVDVSIWGILLAIGTGAFGALVVVLFDDVVALYVVPKPYPSNRP